MTLTELGQLIAAGESERLEFKKSTGQRTDAAKTLCAMLNGKGGHVVFGVTDAGELVGQTISAKTMEEECLKYHLKPPIFREEAGGITVVFPAQIAVEQPKSRPKSRPKSTEERVVEMLGAGPLSKSEIANRLGQKAISGQLKKVMLKLIAEKRIVYTRPWTPRSRLQEYQLGPNPENPKTRLARKVKITTRHSQ